MFENQTDYAVEIAKRLKKLYPEVRVELDHSSPLELLIATLLAAQNRDTTINKITPILFRQYRAPEDYINSPPGELEELIHKSGFFNQKAKAIRALCQKLIDDFGGDVPRTMEELLTLPGVGRKTATVVLGEAMGIAAGITVDLHHLRVEPRLGLSDKKDAVKMERELMTIVPEEWWIKWSQLITWHGRRVCKSKPDCPNCVLNEICPTGRAILAGELTV